METLTHYKKLHNPDYLGAYSLDDGAGNFKDLTVTIEKIVREAVPGADGKKEDCTVAYLKGQKPMVLNITNQKIIAKMYETPYIENWAGKSLTLFVAKIKAFGDVVDALRVRPAKPALPELTPEHERWEGARKSYAENPAILTTIKKNFILSKENETLLTAK